MNDNKNDEPIFRESETLERLGDDHDLVKSMVSFFIDSYQQELLDIENAIKSNDNKNLEMYAHRFKGDLRSVGGDRASTSASVLEEMVKEGSTCSTALATDVLQELTAEVKLLVELLEEFMKRY